MLKAALVEGEENLIKVSPSGLGESVRLLRKGTAQFAVKTASCFKYDPQFPQRQSSQTDRSRITALEESSHFDESFVLLK